jgi:hypothetical protein
MAFNWPFENQLKVICHSMEWVRNDNSFIKILTKGVKLSGVRQNKVGCIKAQCNSMG